jgi:hypothetical protein
MFELFLKQLALIGALSTLVLAGLWPHVRPIVKACIDYLLANFGNLFGYSEQDRAAAAGGPIRRPIHDHPRLSGYTLRRSLPDVVTPKVSLAGYGSPLSSPLMQPHTGNLKQALNTIAQATASQRPADQGQSTVPLSLFTAAIMALVIFSFLKLASPGRQKDRNFHNHGKDPAQGHERAQSTWGRRELPRMNRNERARQLIMQHGSKNVSRAIKYLINELERQKLHLIQGGSSLAENRIPNSNSNNIDGVDDDSSHCCPCSCHRTQQDLDLTEAARDDQRPVSASM